MGGRRVIAAALWAGALVSSTGIGLVAAGFAGAGLTQAIGPDPGPLARVGEPTSSDRPAGSQEATPASPGPSSQRPSSAPGTASGPTGVTPSSSGRGSPDGPGRPPTGQDHRRADQAGWTRTTVTEGGSLVADCSAGWPRMIASPSRGWRAWDDHQGSSDAAAAGVDFTRGRRTLRVVVTCQDGVPDFQVRSVDAVPGRSPSPQDG